MIRLQLVERVWNTRQGWARFVLDILWAAAWVLAASLAAAAMVGVGMPRVSMVFLAAVIFASVGRGVRSGLFAAFAAFAAYDYFWVPPVHVVELRTPFEFVALSMFLTLGVITALASGGLRDRERRSAARQHRLLAFARAGGIVALPPDGKGAGERVTEWVHGMLGTGVYYLDADGTEARAGDAATWWETVQVGLRRLAQEAMLRPGRTLRSADLRARALSDGGELQGVLVWLSPSEAADGRRETDDFVAVIVDLAAAALGRARRIRAAA